MKLFSLLGATVVGLVLFASPGSTVANSTGQVPAVDSLLDREFRSVVTKGLGQVGARGLRLRFFEHSEQPGQEAGSSLVFNAGCNTNASRFRITDDRLIAYGGFTGTDMGCAVDPDQRIAKLLERGMLAQSFGNRLVLSSPNGRVKLVLVPDVPGRPVTMKLLHGKSFRSIQIRGRKLKPTAMNLSFVTGPLPSSDDDKQVDGPLMLGSVGCNSMGGEYRAQAGDLRWVGETYSTAMMCFPFHDGWLGRLLRNGVQAKIAGPVLTLTKGKNRVVMLRRG